MSPTAEDPPGGVSALLSYVPVFANLADGVLVVGRDGMVVFGNEAAGRILGVPPADLLGPIEAFPERFSYRTSDGARPPSVGAIALSGRVVGPLERTIRTPAGEEKGVRTSAAPIRDETGALLGAIVVLGDVTQQQRAVREARAQAAELGRAFQHVVADRQLAHEVIEHGQPMYVVDRDFRYLMVNRAWEQLTGCPRERALGASMWELFPATAERGSQFWTQLNRCLEQGVPVQFEDYYSPLDLWVANRAFPASEDTISVFLEDISERKRAERSLRASEARMRRLFESDLVGVHGFDAEGHVTDANETFLAMTGHVKADLAAGKLTCDGVMSPEFREGARKALEELRRSGTHRPFEGEYLRKDGTTVPVIVGAAFVDEQRTEGIAFSVEINEQRRAREALEDADKRKTEFLAMLSHELRNPLAPIRNAIFLLRHAPAGSSPAIRAQEVIERQTEHLARIVDDLLDVTRISRGKIFLRRSITDLRALARRTCDDHAGTLAACGLRLHCDLPGAALWADVDPTRVAQVLGNLLHNAAKFTPDGGEVFVTLREEPGQASLGVRDTGVGIPRDQLARILEPFTQADPGIARTRGGLGLGLALAKGLVALHGGTLEVRSPGEGMGAEFIVKLPLHAPPSAATGEAGRDTSALHVRRVLIIEDNADAGRTLADVLELQGHQVQLARDGRTGIALARQWQPEVILCDIGLPDLDGYEVGRELRRDPAFSRTKLIALSGYAQPEDRRHSREAGFDAHLPKPAPLDELTALLS